MIKIIRYLRWRIRFELREILILIKTWRIKLRPPPKKILPLAAPSSKISEAPSRRFSDSIPPLPKAIIVPKADITLLDPPKNTLLCPMCYTVNYSIPSRSCKRCGYSNSVIHIPPTPAELQRRALKNLYAPTYVADFINEATPEEKINRMIVEDLYDLKNQQEEE